MRLSSIHLSSWFLTLLATASLFGCGSSSPSKPAVPDAASRKSDVALVTPDAPRPKPDAKTNQDSKSSGEPQRKPHLDAASAEMNKIDGRRGVDASRVDSSQVDALVTPDAAKLDAAKLDAARVDSVKVDLLQNSDGKGIDAKGVDSAPTCSIGGCGMNQYCVSGMCLPDDPSFFAPCMFPQNCDATPGNTPLT